MQNTEPMLVRNPDAQKLLAVGASTYWKLVRQGKLEVVGSGAMSRVTYESVKRYIEELRTAAAAGKAA